MLTVRDLAGLPELELRVAAGTDGLEHEVSWLHVSELDDPPGGWRAASSSSHRARHRRDRVAPARVRPPACQARIAGLGFGVGFGFSDVPGPIVEEADKLSFPVLAIPYDVPFVAITKTAFAHLANEQLEQQTRALAVHERLSDAVIRGRGVEALSRSSATTWTAASRWRTRTDAS